MSSQRRVAQAPVLSRGDSPETQAVVRQGTRGKIDARAAETIEKLEKAQIKNAGALTFPNTDKKPAKFAKMPPIKEKAAVDKAIDVLTDVWKLPRASVLISVTGGAQAFNLDKRLTASFQRGLKAAVRTTKACVVTGGTKCGCMELVGKTLEDEEHLVLMGVSPFNEVHGSALLDESKYLNIHEYHAPQKGDTKPSLDPNHTHHILVSDATFGGEIETRNLIEEAVCREKPDEDEDGEGESQLQQGLAPVSPMVMLVVGGGYGTVKTVHAALHAEGGSTACPVVLVPEAKGAGYYIYEAVHLSDETLSEQVVGAQVAAQWFQDGQVGGDVTQAELGEKLADIVRLSKVKLAHSANQDVPIKFFHTARDDNNNLRDVLLNAILDDCRTTTQAIRLAVEWGDATITRKQLQESSALGSNSLRVELETALLAADYELIKVLTDFKADPGRVRLNRLVGYDLAVDGEVLAASDTFASNLRGAAGNLRAAAASGASRKRSTMRRSGTDVRIDERNSNGDNGDKESKVEPNENVREQVEDLDEYRRISDDRCEPLKDWDANGDGDIKKWCDERSQVGFAVLAFWLGDQLGGYVKTHLECRYLNRGGAGNAAKLRPEWSDIFLWAVLVSQPEIAELLWTKTEDPLRMAVYASLFCRKLAEDVQEGTEQDELLGDADTYEGWAMGLLEEAENDAPTVLLALPLMTRAAEYAGTGEGNEFNKLWPRSTLEAAIGDGIGGEDVRCLKFISHRLCKDLVLNVFNGKIYRLQAEEYIKEKLPAEHMEILARDEADDKLSGSSRGGSLGQASASLDASYINDSKEDFSLFQDHRTCPCNLHVPALGHVFLQRLCKDLENDKADGDHPLFPSKLGDVKLVGTDSVMTAIGHFFSIPRVKAIFHTLFNAVFLLLLTLMLCGFPFWGPVPWAMGGWLHPWMWQSGIYENGEDSESITNLEMLIWLWTLCRLYSEVKQVFRQGCKQYDRSEKWGDYFDYFTDPAQLLDMASLLMVITCAFLRVGVQRDHIPLSTDPFEIDAHIVTQVLYGFVAILMYSRFTSVMKLSGEVGLLYVMFIKMWAEVARWFSLTVFGTLGFAVAFAVMEPGNVVSEGMLTDRPFMRPFWGLVGDFDTTTIADYYPEAGFKGMIGSLSALLLWFYVFVITVVMVNLLIAQMGSAYSRLEERGPLIQQAGFIELCMEFKDLNDSLPPPLNVLLIPFDVLEAWLYLTSKCTARVQEWSASGADRKGAASSKSAYAERNKRLQALYGNQFTWWNQLNKGLCVLVPPEVASFAYARSHSALKTLLKLQAKERKDSEPARLERLEGRQAEMSEAIEQLLLKQSELNQMVESMTHSGGATPRGGGGGTPRRRSTRSPSPSMGLGGAPKPAAVAAGNPSAAAPNYGLLSHQHAQAGGAAAAAVEAPPPLPNTPTAARFRQPVSIAPVPGRAPPVAPLPLVALGGMRPLPMALPPLAGAAGTSAIQPPAEMFGR